MVIAERESLSGIGRLIRLASSAVVYPYWICSDVRTDSWMADCTWCLVYTPER